jgi:hypothetical protein
MTVRCRHATFTDPHVARLAARSMEPNRSKRMVPIKCPDCGRVRLIAPATHDAARGAA